ncbi:hypothetical protein BJX99DRAFT_110535 [Aspergillus californicus]
MLFYLSTRPAWLILIAVPETQRCLFRSGQLPPTVCGILPVTWNAKIFGMQNHSTGQKRSQAMYPWFCSRGFNLSI